MRTLLALALGISSVAGAVDAGTYVLRDGTEGFLRTLTVEEDSFNVEYCSNFVIAGTRKYCCTFGGPLKTEKDGGAVGTPEGLSKCRVALKSPGEKQVSLRLEGDCSSDAVEQECRGFRDAVGTYVPDFRPSFECTVDLKDDEFFLCRFPELARRDREVSALFKKKKIDKATAKALVEKREACANAHSVCTVADEKIRRACDEKRDPKVVACMTEAFDAVLKAKR